MSKTCFLISVIGEAGTPERKHADDLRDYILKPIVTEHFGYKLTRGDEIHEGGLITTQVVQHINQSDLAIADLSFPNPNVYYELAIRHMTRKPVIHLYLKGTKLPFDLKDLRSISFAMDLAGGELAKEELQAKLAALETTPTPSSNPITQALDVEGLRKLNTSEGNQLASLLQGQEAVYGAVRQMQRDLMQVKISMPTIVAARNISPHVDAEQIDEWLTRRLASPARERLEHETDEDVEGQ